MKCLIFPSKSGSLSRVLFLSAQHPPSILLGKPEIQKSLMASHPYYPTSIRPWHHCPYTILQSHPFYLCQLSSVHAINISLPRLLQWPFTGIHSLLSPSMAARKFFKIFQWLPIPLEIITEIFNIAIFSSLIAYLLPATRHTDPFLKTLTVPLYRILA